MCPSTKPSRTRLYADEPDATSQAFSTMLSPRSARP
jgi:hypothetical protein